MRKECLREQTFAFKCVLTLVCGNLVTRTSREIVYFIRLHWVIITRISQKYFIDDVHFHAGIIMSSVLNWLTAVLPKLYKSEKDEHNIL